ncbi:hypothetical protein UP09_17390 [Bradyrhizobium sp. LTSP885]|nr:hypothetical protein UP09_17390 [Bradyrhizobium sp. LTSP885]
MPRTISANSPAIPLITPKATGSSEKPANRTARREHAAHHTFQAIDRAMVNRDLRRLLDIEIFVPAQPCNSRPFG